MVVDGERLLLWMVADGLWTVVADGRMVAGGCGWLWIVVDSCGRLWTVVDGCIVDNYGQLLWIVADVVDGCIVVVDITWTVVLWMIADGCCGWLRMVADGVVVDGCCCGWLRTLCGRCGWLWMVAYGCGQLCCGRMRMIVLRIVIFI